MTDKKQSNPRQVRLQILTNALPVLAGSMPCALSHSQEFGIPTGRYASLKHRMRMKFVKICSLPPFPRRDPEAARNLKKHEQALKSKD